MRSNKDSLLSAICNKFKLKSELAIGFVWLHYKLHETELCTIEQINQYFVDAHLSKYNSTRLKDALRKSKDILTERTGYRPSRKLIETLDQEFNYLLQRSEEIVCDEMILPLSLYSNTRGYIESMAKQINASYEYNIFDGCAVLMRRLMEILLIHTYEANGLSDDIVEEKGYKNLNVIIKDIIDKKRFNLQKQTKDSLNKIRELGNLSAHKIQYTTKKQYIDEVITEYRVIIEELLFRSNIKK